MTTPNSPELAPARQSIAELVTTVRASVRLRDGYYLSEELVDLYLVGVLRGVAVGLLDAEGPLGRDETARNARLEELASHAAELLDHLHRLRPAPAGDRPAPASSATAPPGRPETG